MQAWRFPASCQSQINLTQSQTSKRCTAVGRQRDNMADALSFRLPDGQIVWPAHSVAEQLRHAHFADVDVSQPVPFDMPFHARVVRLWAGADVSAVLSASDCADVVSLAEAMHTDEASWSRRYWQLLGADATVVRNPWWHLLKCNARATTAAKMLAHHPRVLDSGLILQHKLQWIEVQIDEEHCSFAVESALRASQRGGVAALSSTLDDESMRAFSAAARTIANLTQVCSPPPLHAHP